MLKKTTAARASLSLLLVTAPALAQSVPQPATEAGLGSQGESAQFEGGNILGYVLLAAFGVASVWALIDIIDDDGDAIPVRPYSLYIPPYRRGLTFLAPGVAMSCPIDRRR